MRCLGPLVLAAALVVAGCGDDGDGVAAPTSTTTTSVVAPSTTTSTTTTSAATTTTSAATTTTTATETTTTTATDAVVAPVVSTTRVFVDDSRVTPASGDQPERPQRTLDVWVDLVDTDDPRPLVVFAHGLTGHPRSHEMLRTHLAEAGFVVASPAFPLTNRDSGLADAGDIEGQVGDVGFVIDAMLADAEFAPLIDPARIGVVGHSLGGLTTAGVALRPDADPRISAAVVMSAGFGQPREGVSVLVLHGDGDRIVPVDSSIASYALASGRRMFVTLLGGDHNTGIGDDDSAYGPVVRNVTAAFLAHEFDHDPTGAVDALLGIDLSLATVESGTATGSLDDWREFFDG